MFGGGIVWFYRVLAGMKIDQTMPGYKHIIFDPQPAGDVTFASYFNETPFGRAGIKWTKSGNEFRVDVEVPVGSTASVAVPTSSADNVTEGGKKIKNSSLISFTKDDRGANPRARAGVVYTVGSGNYSFVARE
jgi:alpha-L-rhamnosidase